MDDADAPLLDAWVRFRSAGAAPFTIPGHKRRAERVWPTLGRLLESDVPLFAGLDTMKRAAATLTAAEQRGAHFWNADWCRYSTGGSTQVNQVAALALGRPGATVLVARTAHRSTLSALVLAGLEPVWLPTTIDTRLGLPTGLDLTALEQALADHPDAVGVICVEPSYVGTLSDLPAVIDLAHARGVPVVVDQAWGAYFGAHPVFPPHALHCGADVMITSAHKGLPAYSQAAVIAARTERLDRDRLDRAFDALATTSPAGSILASIDAAVALLSCDEGRHRLGRLPDLVASARDRLRTAGLAAPGPEDFPAERFDPAKLVVQFDATDGNRVEADLIAAGVPVEQADRDTIVAVVTMLDDAGTLDRLVAALITAAARASTPRRDRLPAAVWTAPLPRPALSPRTAFFAEHESVPTVGAIGRVSAELIAPYPPGVPVLAPGELVTAEAVESLRLAQRAGLRIAYASEPSLEHIQVVVE